MQGLKVLPTFVDEAARVNKIVDGCTHAWTKNRMPMSHHASRCNKNTAYLPSGPSCSKLNKFVS